MKSREQAVHGSFRLVNPDAGSVGPDVAQIGASFTPNGAATGSIFYGAGRVRGDSHQGYVTSVATWTVAPRASDAGAHGQRRLNVRDSSGMRARPRAS